MSDTPQTDRTDGSEPAEPTLATATRSGPRRRALWAALAVFAVAAGTLAVVAADDDGAPPRLPIALGGADATAEDRSTAGDQAAASTADMTMMASVHYSAGDDLPPLGGSAGAYRLSGDLDLDAFRAVAAALGLSGEPEVRDGVARLESDGQALEASEYSGGAWWYSPVYDDGGGASGSSGSGASGMTPEEQKEAEAVAADDPDATTRPSEPAEPTVAEDLPSEDEARGIALDLLRAAGIDLDGAKVTVDGPYEAWYVGVEPRVDGRAVSGLYAGVSVGPHGEVLSANGWLNDPERLGDYQTVDTREVIERLNDGSAYHGGAVDEAPMVAEEGRVGGDAADPDAPVSSDQDPILIDPMPAEPSGPAEPLEVVLHHAERILLLFPANDGSTDSYLVPAYRMWDHDGDDRHLVDVPAVADDALLPDAEQPAPDTVPSDGTPGCAQPEPGPDGAVPDICLEPTSVPPAEAETDPGVGEG